MASVVAHPRPRFLLLVAGLLAALFLLASVDGCTPTAAAQEPGVEEGADKDAAPAAATPPRRNIFIHLITSVGLFFGIVFLIMSIALVTLVVLLAMELRMGAAVPPAFVEDFTDTVNKRRFKEAYEMAREDSSFVARVLTAGMSRLQYGIEDAREACFNMVDSVRAGKEQLIVYLATIGTLGPLLGLVGTVFGMILAFMELATTASGINAQRLADAISHALVITLLGIGMSVPAIFCHAFFRNRLTRITNDAATVADDLLTQMYYNSKKAAPAGEPALDSVPRVPTPPIPPTPAIKPK
jgi:biopolymer transport protein ExbB